MFLISLLVNGSEVSSEASDSGEYIISVDIDSRLSEDNGDVSVQDSLPLTNVSSATGNVAVLVTAITRPTQEAPDPIRIQ